MASTGAQAWVKYFQGQGDVNTVVKKETPLLDSSNISIRRLVKGDKIILLESTSYESKMKVKYENILGYISFNNLSKPGKKSGIGVPSLKPQAFNIKDNINYTIDNYIKTVLDSIEDRVDLTSELKLYLTCLIKYYINECSTSELSLLYNIKLPRNEINKDFGEVLGPVAIFKNRILASKGINIQNTDKIYVPSRPNEPLLDYSIVQGQKSLAISAKSGTTTNTVKPADIISLLKKNPSIFNKHKNTLQFKVFEAISEGNSVSGPLIVASILKNKYKEFEGIDLDKAKKVTKNTKLAEIEKMFFSYLTKNKLLKNDVFHLSYSVEKKIQDISKSTLSFNEIFSDAITGNVIYVKYNNLNGIPSFDVYIADDFRKKKIFIRTKNGNTRSNDKLGIQT